MGVIRGKTLSILILVRSQDESFLFNLGLKGPYYPQKRENFYFRSSTLSFGVHKILHPERDVLKIYISLLILFLLKLHSHGILTLFGFDN